MRRKVSKFDWTGKSDVHTLPTVQCPWVCRAVGQTFLRQDDNIVKSWSDSF